MTIVPFFLQGTEICIRKINPIYDSVHNFTRQWMFWTQRDLVDRLDQVFKKPKQTLRYWVHNVPLTSSDSEEILITPLRSPRKPQKRKSRSQKKKERHARKIKRKQIEHKEKKNVKKCKHFPPTYRLALRYRNRYADKDHPSQDGPWFETQIEQEELVDTLLNTKQ